MFKSIAIQSFTKQVDNKDVIEETEVLLFSGYFSLFCLELLYFCTDNMF